MILGKPLQYIKCQLHGNELPLKALLYYYDGKPCGPVHWRGPIAKRIKESVSNMTVVDFQPIRLKLLLTSVGTRSTCIEYAWL